MRSLVLLVVLSGCGGEPQCVEDAGPVDGEWRLTFESLEGGECWLFEDPLYATYPSSVDFYAFEVSGLLDGSCGGEYDGAPRSSINEQHGDGSGEAPWSVVFSEIHASEGEVTARFESDGIAGVCAGNVTAVKVSAPPL